jgi:UDP-N-acetylmuramate--alanine ligase
MTKYVYGRTILIDDYAHHPNEIKSTLNAIKDLKRRKIAIFQPHRYTRLKGLWSEFLESFDVVDELYVVETFNAGDKFDETYNSKNFVEAIVKKGVKAKYIQGSMDVAGAKIAPEIKQGDIVLTLGAGDITKIGGVINGLLAVKN